MNATDQQKLVNAGFTIIRKEDFNYILRIKVKNNDSREWRTLEKGFATNAALGRRMKELLQDEKTVED
jgi:hypothetical protein